VRDVNSTVTTLKLFCLKDHVRARDSTLWRYRWQEASEFLCTKIPLFGGSYKIAGKPQKCSLRQATNVTFSKFRGWRCQKKAAVFWNRVLIILLIRINSWPKILRSCFLHCMRHENVIKRILLAGLTSRANPLFRRVVLRLFCWTDWGNATVEVGWCNWRLLVETSKSTAAEQHLSHVGKAVGQ